ncbi:hypothetical protein ACQB60_20760 [Actinomycetota bacterium Odt1-20B]
MSGSGERLDAEWLRGWCAQTSTVAQHFRDHGSAPIDDEDPALALGSDGGGSCTR